MIVSSSAGNLVVYKRMTLEMHDKHDSWGNCTELLSAEDAKRLDENDWVRADGGVICCHCQKNYYSHPHVIGALWLTRLCDNRLVKL